jgi:hypothetical protein
MCNPPPSSAFISELRNSDKGLKTINEYLAAVKSFTRWLWRDKRAAFDPLIGLSRLAGKGKVDIQAILSGQVNGV